MAQLLTCGLLALYFFQLLTGQLPFDPEAPDGDVSAAKSESAVFKTMIGLWDFWVRASLPPVSYMLLLAV